MRPIETVLPPARWTLEQVLDLAELMTRFILHPDRANDRVGHLRRGMLEVVRDDAGRPVSMSIERAELGGEGLASARCAPEIRRGGAPTLHSDFYLLGVVLYEVMAGMPLPTHGDQEQQAASLRYHPGLSQILTSALSNAKRSVMTGGAILEAITVARAQGARRIRSLETAQVSVLGRCAPRLRNQDACGAFVWQEVAQSMPGVAACLMVADGVGSTVSGGEVAARVMRELGGGFFNELMEAGYASLATHTATHCRRIVMGAVRRTVEACRADAQLEKGGSTCVVALLAGQNLSVANLGDSRAYLLSETGDIVPLTFDQSVAGAAYVAGQVGWPYLRSGWGDIIMRCISSGSDATHLDALQALEDALPGEPSVRLMPGDQILLMSDGVWGSLSEAEIAALASPAFSAQEAAEALVEAVEAARGDDNTSILIARPHFSPAPDLPRVGPIGRRY